MRTTVNIDEHLLAEAKVLAARQHRSLGEIVDDALRVALRPAVVARAAVVLPVDGDPDGSLLVDIYDKDAIAELLGDNARTDADR